MWLFAIFLDTNTTSWIGHKDPRHDATGEVDLRLTWLYRALNKQDPATQRVKPLPLRVLHEAQARSVRTPLNHALLDAAYIGFFFMIRAGEYLDTATGEDRPIRLRNITFTRHEGPTWAATHAPLHAIQHCTYAGITFDDQKNGHKDMTVVHHLSGHPTACPVRALQRRTRYLRDRAAPPDTPITAVLIDGAWYTPLSSQFTDLLRSNIQPSDNLQPNDVTPRSLCSGGAMALLLAGVDKTIIQLVGRWKSEAIFSYLHSTALALTRTHAPCMVKHGSFRTIPSSTTLQDAMYTLEMEFPFDANGS